MKTPEQRAREIMAEITDDFGALRSSGYPERYIARYLARLLRRKRSEAKLWEIRRSQPHVTSEQARQQRERIKAQAKAQRNTKRI